MKIEEHLIRPHPPFPNNPDMALIHYRAVIDKSTVSPEFFETIFENNTWTSSWRNGVYSFHHFHSTAHEAFGCYSGRGRILFGGPEGIEVELSLGDALLVPAGVSHMLLESTSDFHVVGSYPLGTDPDLCRGSEKDYEVLVKRIKKLPSPLSPPVTDADVWL
jgi:uncharacterized protein YjlB